MMILAIHKEMVFRLPSLSSSESHWLHLLSGLDTDLLWT